MEHFSVPAVVFLRENQNRFPQRNEPSSAKTKLFCRKALPASAERGVKQGFGGLFPLWMESARVQAPFVLLPAVPLAGLTWRAGSCRTAFRGGRQNVAETGFRLSSCIPLGARGSRISVLFPSRARLHGSRRGCLDVLAKCHLGSCCCPPVFWRLRDRRRLEACGATGTGKGVSEAHLSFLPGIAEIYGCLYWTSTEPRKLGARWFAKPFLNKEILRHKEVVTQDFMGWAVAPVYLLKCNVCPMRSFLVRMYFSSYGVTGTSMGTFSTISSP